jgi:extracellular elastinolytic metalloproteinase
MHNVTHLYFNRILYGVQVSNHNAAIHMKDGHVRSYSHSFNGYSILFAKRPSVVISLRMAVRNAEDLLGVPRDKTEAFRSYTEVADGRLLHVHNFQLRNDTASKWFMVSVDTDTGNLTLT